MKTKYLLWAQPWARREVVATGEGGPVPCAGREEVNTEMNKAGAPLVGTPPAGAEPGVL